MLLETPASSLLQGEGEISLLYIDYVSLKRDPGYMKFEFNRKRTEIQHAFLIEKNSYCFRKNTMMFLIRCTSMKYNNLSKIMQ